MELSFVHVSGKPEKSSRAVNKIVRSHVMRTYKRQQRKKTLKRGFGQEIHTRVTAGTPATPYSASSISGDTFAGSGSTPSAFADEPLVNASCASPGKLLDVSHILQGFDDGGEMGFDEIFASEYNDFTSMDLTTWLDGSLDPFSCLPIQSTPHALVLLQQNASRTIRTSVHADPDNLWRHTCSSNPAWLFMTMFYAASRFADTSRPKPVEDTDYLVQSISAVNETISKSPGCVDDSTIATVACLANIENLNGFTLDASVHISGLIRMVQLRGGLDKLGMQGILRRMVLWSDLLASSRLERPPCFPFSPAPGLPELSTFTPTVPPHVYELDLNKELTPITTIKHGISISRLMLLLHKFSMFLNLTGFSSLPWEARYPDRVYEVEYRFLQALFDDGVLATGKEPLAIGTMLFHAGLLFIYTNLRETPVGGAIRKRLLSRLKDALSEFDWLSCAQNYMAEMLWALLLGASTSTGDEKRFFLDNLEILSLTHNIHQWHDVSKLLEKAPALEIRRLNMCMDVWAELSLIGLRSPRIIEIESS